MCYYPRDNVLIRGSFDRRWGRWVRSDSRGDARDWLGEAVIQTLNVVFLLYLTSYLAQEDARQLFECRTPSLVHTHHLVVCRPPTTEILTENRLQRGCWVATAGDCTIRRSRRSPIAEPPGRPAAEPTMTGSRYRPGRGHWGRCRPAGSAPPGRLAETASQLHSWSTPTPRELEGHAPIHPPGIWPHLLLRWWCHCRPSCPTRWSRWVSEVSQGVVPQPRV